MNVRAPLSVPEYAWEVKTGLRSRPKSLPCKLFYDECGSELFEEITRLPEYYLTRAEAEILENHATAISEAAGTPLSVVELGAGTAAKTVTLLRAVARRQLRVKYCPVDISWSALAQAKQRVLSEFPDANVQPITTDFGSGFSFLRGIAGRKLVLYLGSSIGNFEDNDAVTLLRNVGKHLSPGGALLLGTDMVKSESVLIPAYDDAQGITARFNKNILARLNRELMADFDLSKFRHVAEWNPIQSRIEIYLESLCLQIVNLRSIKTVVRFAPGERIHTENSHKYSVEAVRRMLCVAGFRLEQTWFDSRNWFGLHLARIQE